MNYKEYYEAFNAEHDETPKTADDIGDAIMKMAQYFMGINDALATAEESYYATLANLTNTEDEKSGKPIAISKAEILAKATPEYMEVNMLRKNLVNCEQGINALKAKSKGSANEYAHLSNT